MPTVHADCQAGVDGRDLSRSVTEGLPGEGNPRFLASFADFCDGYVPGSWFETGRGLAKDLSGNNTRFDCNFLFFSLIFFLELKII